MNGTTSRYVTLALENVMCARLRCWEEVRGGQEGLEHEASDKHRQTLLEGIGLGDDSAEVEREEIWQGEDANMLGEAERKKCATHRE